MRAKQVARFGDRMCKGYDFRPLHEHVLANGLNVRNGWQAALRLSHFHARFPPIIFDTIFRLYPQGGLAQLVDRRRFRGLSPGDCQEHSSIFGRRPIDQPPSKACNIMFESVDGFDGPYKIDFDRASNARNISVFPELAQRCCIRSKCVGRSSRIDTSLQCHREADQEAEIG
jgi:hypothetical protein